MIVASTDLRERHAVTTTADVVMASERSACFYHKAEPHFTPVGINYTVRPRTRRSGYDTSAIPASVPGTATARDQLAANVALKAFPVNSPSRAGAMVFPNSGPASADTRT